jgi:hypothetical protein
VIHTPNAPSVPDDALGPPEDLDARGVTWRETGDPSALWPGITLDALQHAGNAIGSVVAARLEGRDATLGAADGTDARAIGIAGLVTSTGPLLGHWVERGTLDVSDELAVVLAQHLDHGRRRMDRMTQGARPALRALADAGVGPRIIKGFHTAHDYFPEPGVRPISDIDVILTPNVVERAEAAMGSVGFTGDALVMTPYKREWDAPDSDRRPWSVELWHARARWKIELQSGLHFGHLNQNGAALVADDSMYGPWSAFDIPLRVAKQPLLVVALATHASGELFSSRLLRLVELIFVVRRDTERGVLDWAAVADLLERSDVSRFAYPAFALAESLAPGTIDAGVLARTRRASTVMARRVVDGMTPSAPIIEHRVSLAERLMWARGPFAIVERLARMLTPRNIPRGDILHVYRGRIRRLLSGRVSMSAPDVTQRPPA